MITIITLEVAVETSCDVQLYKAEQTGRTVGFILKDGTIARPILGFEQQIKEDSYKDITTAEHLGSVGITVADYIKTEIEEAD